jgi:FkbM family methyltransferase
MNYGPGGEIKSSGELNVLKHIKETLYGEKPLVLFDVGANAGSYSKILSNFFENNSIIYAFEPSKKAFDKFLKTTLGIPNIVSNNFGFGDCESSVLLYTNSDGSGLASVYQRNLEHIGVSMDKSEEVRLSTIDNYCEQNRINRIHFLKLDVEGHELKVLHGAQQMLDNKNIDFIQFEFGGTDIDSRTYYKDFYLLLKDKYRIYRILKNGLFEMPQYQEIHEIFITTNYLAKRKTLS